MTALPPLPVHVVGLVASAGGLDALLDLLPRLQPNGRTAWVVAQHMGGQAQGDLMVRLLARTSALPVQLAQHEQPLQPDVVYLIPAGQDGRVVPGALLLAPPRPGSLSTPSGNVLLESLAAACAPFCTAVVLSGAGRDGVEGARAVRQAGGRVFAQDPDSIQFNGMPGAAVRAGVVDAVLAVDALAAALNGVAAGPAPDAHGGGRLTNPAAGGAGGMPALDPQAPEWQQLLGHIERATGVDVSAYKEDTLLRRVQRRLEALGVPSLRAYLAHGERHPQEWYTLQHLFLVSHSAFFRDRSSFNVVWAALRERLQHRPAPSPLRIWVPGCASGEEVYTYAIMLAELLGEAQLADRAQVWGFDLNAQALERARRGQYRPSAVREVEPSLLQRHFSQHGELVQVHPSLQACCHFEQRNVFDVVEPSTFDVISCRNLLIYLKPPWQDRLLRHFHQTLRPDGLLFLSPVESVGVDGARLFTALDRDHRLYRRREPGRSPAPLH